MSSDRTNPPTKPIMIAFSTALFLVHKLSRRQTSWRAALTALSGLGSPQIAVSWILTSSLAAYDCPRHVGSRHVAATTIHNTRGFQSPHIKIGRIARLMVSYS